MLRVFVGPTVQGLNQSPFCTKLETWLRMVGLEYERAPFDPMKAPKGKMPYVELDGRRIADSSDIVDHLKATADITDPDAWLDERQLGLARLLQRTAEEHLYWALLWTRWVADDGWPATRAAIVPTLPPVVGGLLLDRVMRPRVRKAMRAHGLGLHDAPDILRRGREDVEAIGAVFVGPFVLGEHPCTADASVFAMLAPLALAGPGPLSDAVKDHPDLRPYVRRMLAAYWAETEAVAAA